MEKVVPQQEPLDSEPVTLDYAGPRPAPPPTVGKVQAAVGPEMLGGALLAVLVAMYLGERRPGALALVGLIGLPVGGIAIHLVRVSVHRLARTGPRQLDPINSSD